MTPYPQENRPLSQQERAEQQEWLASLRYVMNSQGPDRARQLLSRLNAEAYQHGVDLPFTGVTSYINTIPPHEQPPFPGDRELERRIKSLIRWNAMAMVVNANRNSHGIGGHISTFASAATLWEIGFNHFWRARTEEHCGDTVYFQGHASPGVYARAFMEGRLDVEQLQNFRRELQDAPGLSSYPHPWLMPEFWEFPTVSMGLSPLMGIYQARFQRYMEDRGLIEPSDAKVWVLGGDGEMDEPESLGAIHLAGNEELDNLIFVINCNLQRLDGPVRGNGSIVRELEGQFRGAGWRVIKVLWGSVFDPMLQSEAGDKLIQRMDELRDGDLQKFVVAGGDYIRKEFFGKDPDLAKLVEHMSDEALWKLRRGGHDPEKVYAAFHAAVRTQGQPTVILAQTIKGYGQGEAGEGRNISHKQKELNEQELIHFRDRFNVPIPDEKLAEVPFYRPEEDSPEIQYLKARREELGGYMPARRERAEPLDVPDVHDYPDLLEATEDKAVSTTMMVVRMLSRLLRDENLGKRLVPIVSDEARTFGMESMFRQCGIYSHVGQLYEPVDRQKMLYYKEAVDGQILEEGITEAGCLSSFIAAGTSTITFGQHMIPVFLFYSMFGFQRVGDLIWAACDARARGFLIGGTSGRTTLNGEGLQHQDGNSLLTASTYPNVLPYDAATGYEAAVIFFHGLKRMYAENHAEIFYLTVQNENHEMPAMPEGVEEGICRGLYPFKTVEADEDAPWVQLLGSGSILFEVLRAQDILAEKYGINSVVHSATSYALLAREAMAAERHARLHPGKKAPVPYVTEQLSGGEGPVIAASDSVRAVPEQIARWVPGGLTALGTDGFGRSDSREDLRKFFEVDAEHVVLTALGELAARDAIPTKQVTKAIKQLKIDTDGPAPWTV